MVLNKTKTSRKRSITVYPPTQQMKENWFKIAKQEGQSVSNFVIEVIESYIQDGNSANPKKNLLKNIETIQEQNETLRCENIELQKKVDTLDTLTNRYEEQLQSNRNKAFIENDKKARIRDYQKNLSELFLQKTSISENEIIDLLHIDPQDTETLKAINKQIEELEDYGVLQKIRGGWRWKK